VSIEKKFFEENMVFFEEKVKNIIDYTCSTMKPILNSIKDLTTKFIDKQILDGEVFKLVSENINIEELFDAPSDAIEEFTLIIMENLSPNDIDNEKPTNLSNYDNFMYTIEHKLESRKYAFWLKNSANTSVDTQTAYYSTNWFFNSDERSREKAEKLGLKLYPEKPMNNILMSFVLNNFIGNTSNLAKLVALLMETSRKEPGIFNKYDEIDLETSYMLIAISNEIKDSYDSFLEKIKKNFELPNEYPIEFILRLISRILNVTIKFYNSEMICTYIDNTLYQIYKEPIIIHQQNCMQYYIMHTKDQPFVPICTTFQDVNIFPQNSSKDINTPERLTNINTISANQILNTQGIKTRKIKIFEV
jgi:hypothetical protein